MKAIKVNKLKCSKRALKIKKDCRKNITYIKQLRALGCSDSEIANALSIKEADLYLYGNC